MSNAPIGVVFDFDGTLTPKEYVSIIKIVEASCLPEPLRGRTDKLRASYYKNAVPGKDPSRFESRLINSSLRAYRECGLPRTEWRAALREIRLREGVVETIRELTGRGIRVGIISFSVADFIEGVLESNGLGSGVHRVYAARLTHNNRGCVCGWQKQSVVYPLNKGIWSTVFARQFGIPAERLLAVGDSLGDKFLGLRQDLRLGIAKDAEDAKSFAEYMGDVVVTEDYAPVRDWINRQIAGLTL